MESDKIDMSLEAIIEMSKKKNSFNSDGGERRKLRRSAPYGRPNPARNDQSFRKRPTSFRRSDNLKRSPEPDVWRHDMFDDDSKKVLPQIRFRPNQESNSAVLKISNLHFNVSEDDIAQLFEEFGTLLRSTLHYDKSGRSLGTAEVEFSSRGDAERAEKQYNGVNLDDQPMKIELAGGRSTGSSNLSSRLGSRQDQSFDRPARNFNRPARNFDRPAGNFSRRPQNFDRPARNNNTQRGGQPRRSNDGRRKDMTTEQLDAELEDYLNKGVEEDNVMA